MVCLLYWAMCCKSIFHQLFHCFVQILVWHTQTKSNKPANKATAATRRYNETNIGLLQELVV